LSSPPPPLSFIFLSPKSWNSFKRYHFCIYIYVYTFLAQYSPFSFPWHFSFPTGPTFLSSHPRVGPALPSYSPIS
jgi:hypothetical protein